MRKLGATGMAAALCAGLALTSARADDGDGGDLRSMPPSRPSWWSVMFGSKEKVAEPKKLPPVAPTPPRPVRNDPATIQAREESALHRRLAVCDELNEIADRNGDDALRERVYQLSDRAWAVYQQRTGATAPRSSDEAALTRPAHSVPDANRRAEARESPIRSSQGEQP